MHSIRTTNPTKSPNPHLCLVTSAPEETEASAADLQSEPVAHDAITSEEKRNRVERASRHGAVTLSIDPTRPGLPQALTGCGAIDMVIGLGPCVLDAEGVRGARIQSGAIVGALVPWTAIVKAALDDQGVLYFEE